MLDAPIWSTLQQVKLTARIPVSPWMWQKSRQVETFCIWCQLKRCFVNHVEELVGTAVKEGLDLNLLVVWEVHQADQMSFCFKTNFIRKWLIWFNPLRSKSSWKAFMLIHGGYDCYCLTDEFIRCSEKIGRNTQEQSLVPNRLITAVVLLKCTSG